MKTLILFLFLISTSAFAVNFCLPESKVGKEQLGDFFITNGKDSCEKKNGSTCWCSKNTFINYRYAKVEPLLEPDYENSSTTKSEVEVCSGQNDCTTKRTEKTCTDILEHPQLNYPSYTEVFCTKLILPLKDFGNKHVVADAVKKATNDLIRAQVSARTAIKKIGRAKRMKCEEARNFISGAMDANTEEENDAMEALFSDIQDALVKCRYKKVKRLIGEVDNPDYDGLKTTLLNIVN